MLLYVINRESILNQRKNKKYLTIPVIVGLRYSVILYILGFHVISTPPASQTDLRANMNRKSESLLR